MDDIEHLIIDALTGNMKRGVSERVIAYALARDIRAAIQKEIVDNLSGSLFDMLFPKKESWQPDDD